VFDRDVTANELIGSSETRYLGQLPLQFRDRFFTAECRMASQERVQELLAPILVEADRSLPRIERAHVQLQLPSAGYPSLLEARAR
jgi:hypothetical protein